MVEKQDPQPIGDLLSQSERFEKGRQEYLRKRDGQASELTDVQRESLKAYGEKLKRLDKALEFTRQQLLAMYAAQFSQDVAPFTWPEDKDHRKILESSVVSLLTRPDRGVVVSGQTGTGKTVMAKTCHRIAQRVQQPFPLYNCIQVAQHLTNNEDAQYQDYDRDRTTFDDLGAEPAESVRYGNRTNVMADLIQYRYNLFQDHGVLTHFTTNLMPEEIGERYGARVLDRLREMCSFHLLPWDSFRGQ